MSNSLTETQLIPLRVRNQGLTRCFVYTGPSMEPTFHPGHLLYVRPTARDITPGDVVVFANPSGNGHIVHRVVSTTDAGLLTRGDNNRLTDFQPVAPEQLVGRVEMLEDQGCFEPVRGGKQGLRSARIGWGARRASLWLRRPLSPLYRALRNSSTVRRVLGRWLSPHLEVVRVETPSGPLFKTTYRGRVVARWWPQRSYFECRKPYDLVIPRPDGANHKVHK